MSDLSTPNALVPQLSVNIGWLSPATANATVVGEIDLTTTPRLRDLLLGAMRSRVIVLLDVDLSGVSFLDCSGIGALVLVRNAAIQNGRQMRVTHPQPFVRHVLDVVGLLDAFGVEPHPAEPVLQ